MSQQAKVQVYEVIKKLQVVYRACQELRSSL